MIRYNIQRQNAYGEWDDYDYIISREHMLTRLDGLLTYRPDENWRVQKMIIVTLKQHEEVRETEDD